MPLTDAQKATGWPDFFFEQPSVLDKPIDYIDPAPKPFIVQIPLVEYFERTKRMKADPWQHDFCQRLQDAVVNRHLKRTWSVVHAEARLGKSVILAQCFPAWMLGHQPDHQIALSTYNVTRSQAHSQATVGIMNLPIHKAIFPNKDGWVRPNAAMSGWKTEKRLSEPDAEFSYNPVGLQSGLTGAGFQTLIIDDPYADQAEAFSETIRRKLQQFWNFTVTSRVGLYTNVFAMFHRYHQEDLAGFLLDKGNFDYWRYATICDGDYVHEATGRHYVDPIGRQIGEYISPRRGPEYYKEVRKDPRVWNSMNQGKPSSDEGDFFKVDRIAILDEVRGREEWGKCDAITRAWDHAATDGAGDFTAGGLIGIQPDGTVIVKDMRLVQFNSGRRAEFQKRIAKADGKDVPICIPEEVGEAGKTLVFFLTEYLKGFSVHPRKVQTNQQTTAIGNNAKQRRAYNFSVAVNAGQVKFVRGKWNKDVLRALRDFGFTTFDDPVDALGDGYNFIFENISKGLVIKSQPIFQTWNDFALSYGPVLNGNGQKSQLIPAHWTVYAALKISADATLPNSGVIIARAAENSGLTDTLFIVDEYKNYPEPYEKMFEWLDGSLHKYCEKPKAATIRLHPDSAMYATTIRRKLEYPVIVAEEVSPTGLVETNWYTQNGKLIGLGELPNVKQEASQWGFSDKGEPTKIGQVWECIRMIAFEFRTRHTRRTDMEKMMYEMPPEIQPDNVTTAQQRMGQSMYLERQFEEMRKKREDDIPDLRSRI